MSWQPHKWVRIRLWLAGGLLIGSFALLSYRPFRGGNDRTLKLWDLCAGRERVTLEWHLDSVNAVAFAPDGLTATAGGFEKILIWDVEGV